MKRLLKDKRGMTLTEMLVALTLLMIVVVGTTPVMLSSYDGLYQAGEKTQSSYEAKSEIEDTLATRNSTDIVENFKVNFAGLGQVFTVNGKRAISSLENSLESVFMGGKAYVAIVSSKIINDDKLSHDVVLQTTNITFASKDDISYNSPSRVTQDGNGEAIDVSLYLPDKSKQGLSNIYGTIALGDGKGIEVTEANHETGRIYIKVKGVDFTNSPAKIQITYLDETDRTLEGKPKIKKASCYLTIKTPTIMAVGKTTHGDYYTSAGVETFKNPNGTTYNKLYVDARRMDIGGTTAGYTKAIPQGTVFKSVNWITEYETNSNGEGNNEDVDMAKTVYEPAYYVLTGTNGAIYRTYSFNGYNTEVVGKVNPSIPGNDSASFTAKYHALAAQSGEDVVGIADSIYTLDDSKSTIVYPAVWGGDFSHIYAYSTFKTSMGYYNQGTWYTQDGSKSGKGQAGYYSNFVNYAYYYNGWGMDFNFYTQNSRKLSYILTERPNALRVGGYLEDIDDYDYGLNRMWERPGYEHADGTWESQKESEKKKNTMKAWWYYKGTENFPRCVGLEISQTAENNFSKDSLNELPVYFCAYNGSDGLRGDNGFANIRLKAMTTYYPKHLVNRMDLVEKDTDDAETDIHWAYNTSANQAKIAVTDAVYIPATTTTSGGVFYVGTVAAYGFVQQVDNIGTNDSSPDADRIINNGSDNTGSPSCYWIMGDDEGTSTTVYKYSFTGKTYDHAGVRKTLMVQSIKDIETDTGIKANSPDSHSFYVTRTGGTTVGKLFNDVYFTMGFASNREMVYSKIVYGADSYGNVKEQHKFCEPYYFLSHYDDTTNTHIPDLYMNDTAAKKDKDRKDVNSTNATVSWLNSADNDYYNVWFPGEMYNLTKVATKDGVTVSVGYAVAGSSYTYLNTANNASTGLGSIFNDGVLAAMVLGKDKAFTNLLYFKDTENFDNSSLSSGYYSSAFGTYGTHARDSVQFTCVDISVESVLSGSDEVSTYYAYYADNKGRLYKSKVATKTTSKSATTSSTPVLVSHIADEPYDGTRSAPSYMEEIKINGQSLGDYFSKITTVSCDGDYIIVGGHSKDSNFKLVIGKITYQQDSAGNPISSSVSWKLVTLSSYGHLQTEDILILDGYAYVAGASKKTAGVTNGFVYAISLDEINANTSLTYNSNLFVGDDKLQDPLYSIAGHK